MRIDEYERSNGVRQGAGNKYIFRLKVEEDWRIEDGEDPAHSISNTIEDGHLLLTYVQVPLNLLQRGCENSTVDVDEESGGEEGDVDEDA